MPSVYNFTSSLPIWILLINLVWLLWLGLWIWIVVVRVCILGLFQDLVGRLSVFYHWILYWLWICHKWLLLRYILSIPTVVKVFIINDVGFIKFFFYKEIALSMLLSNGEMNFQMNFPIVAGNVIWPLMGNFSHVGLNLLERISRPHTQIDVCVG